MRTVITPAILTILMLVQATLISNAEEPAWRHGTTLIEPLKYPKDFKHFDYVNPNAPKGGSVRFGLNGSFDTFNPVLSKGRLAAGIGHVNVAGGSGYVYERLMTQPMDEHSAEYGVIAEEMRYPSDFSWVTYRLRENARWHDGKPITPEDVVWTYNISLELNIQQAHYYKHVKSAKVTGPREVTFTFDQKGNRELPQILGQQMVLPKHWWEGKDADGKQRDIKASTLELPMGSGPYRVSKFVAGRSVTLERVKDYWGKDLNVNIGHYNLDKIKYEYFRDETARFEAFKSGALDWRTESTARKWATNYEFPAVKKGYVVLKQFDEIEGASGLMVGFIPNLRRKKFQDIRVREALNLAFNFEDLNRTIFFDQYKRINSYFYGSSLASKELPEGQELEILKSLKNPIPGEIFTTEYANPVSNSRTDERKNRRKALRLLKAAGYKIEKSVTIDPATGKQLTIEFLMNGPTFEPIATRYVNSLKHIGILLKLRVVDSSQYIERIRNRDFDLIYTGWAQSMSLGNEQLDYFGSGAADQPTSRNYPGIKNPAIDELINIIIFAKDRAELVAATKAYDRVLLWNRYTVPGYTLLASRVARWDRYSHPEPLPKFTIGFPDVWWYDEAKAAKIK